MHETTESKPLPTASDAVGHFAIPRMPSVLARFSLFRSLGSDAIHALDARCGWRQAGPKQWIVDMDGDGTDVFFVLRGHLRVVVTVAGRETILRDLIRKAEDIDADAIIGLDYQNDTPLRSEETGVNLKRIVATGLAVKLSCAA